MTKRECAIVEAYTGYVMLIGEDTSEFYKYIAEKMHRPVYTHEMASKEIQKQIKMVSREDFIDLCRSAT